MSALEGCQFVGGGVTICYERTTPPPEQPYVAPDWDDEIETEQDRLSAENAAVSAYETWLWEHTPYAPDTSPEAAQYSDEEPF